MDNTLKGLDKIYDDFIEKLIDGYVYYIPMEVFEEDVLEHLKSEIEDDFFYEFNALVKGEFGSGNVNDLRILIMNKNGTLEKSVFDLLKLKRVLLEAEFKIVINKYLNYAEILASIAKWLLDNLELYMNINGDMDAKTVFGLQYNCLVEHFKQLYETFGEEYNYQLTTFFTSREIASKYVPDFYNRVIKFSNKYPLAEDASDIIERVKPKPINKSNTKRKTKKKLQLITEEKAELFLLESVFDIKIQK